MTSEGWTQGILGTMAVAERDGIDLDPDEVLQLIADREKQEASASPSAHQQPLA